MLHLHWKSEVGTGSDVTSELTEKLRSQKNMDACRNALLENHNKCALHTKNTLEEGKRHQDVSDFQCTDHYY